MVNNSSGTFRNKLDAIRSRLLLKEGLNERNTGSIPWEKNRTPFGKFGKNSGYGTMIPVDVLPEFKLKS